MTSKIHDCFIFSNEVELLKLRLAVMGPHVDRFLVVEGTKTFSGQTREAQFPKIRASLPYGEKIDYVLISNFPETDDPWVREHFLRDQIRANVAASDDDLVLVSDVDEIINLPAVLPGYDHNEAARIELPTHYHFADVRSSELISVNLITPFRIIKEINIGNRNTYAGFAKTLVKDSGGENGGHFTYMFGYDVARYVTKINQFSHQELNTPYMTDRERILKCVKWNFDVFERHQFAYRQVPLHRLFPGFLDAINQESLSLPIKATTTPPDSSLLRWTDMYYWQRSYHQYRYARARFKRRCLAIIGRSSRR